MANWEEGQRLGDWGKNRERISPRSLWRTRRACGRYRRLKRQADIEIEAKRGRLRGNFTYWNDVEDAHDGGWRLRENRHSVAV